MGHGGMTVDEFPTFEEAKDFADWLRDDMAMCGDYIVEFDEIAAFAQAVEEAALASTIEEAPFPIPHPFVKTEDDSWCDVCGGSDNGAGVHRLEAR